MSAFALVAAVATALAAGSGARAQGTGGPRLRPGSTEVGLAGSLVSVSGATRGSFELRLGRFAEAASGLLGYEAQLGYAHVSALDALELQGALTWQRGVGEGSIWPFAGLGGGLRQEWIGSFADARYPVGVNAGFRALAGARAGVRGEYRYRRVLGDPAADFDEHQILVGLSLFLGGKD